jgi:hypothetical protein
MKNIFKHIILISTLIIHQVAAQNNSTINDLFFKCATDNLPLQNQSFASQASSGPNCSKTSTNWTQHYQYIDSYKPTSASYEAIKTIPINIVVFGEDDGSLFPFHIGQDMPNMASYFDPSGVEIPNPYITTSANVNFFEGWLNQANVNTAAPSGNGIYFNGPGTADDVPYTFQICNPSSLPDSKIRYVIKHYYFYKNSTINNLTGSQTNIDELARNLHLGANPGAINQINCYLYKYFNVAGAGGWSYETSYNNQTVAFTSSTSKIYEYINNPDIPGGPDDWVYISAYWYFFGHLPHELGHRLSLWHTYNSIETYQSNAAEFLNDVFSCYTGSPQQITGGNNLMGNYDPIAISPRQMGRMHRVLSTDKGYDILGNSTRHFAYGYSPIPHEITGNETWDFTYKSYNDIVVKKGATLTLTCRLEMVKEASIIVEQGGLLVVDGATITSARCGGPEYEGLWKGIQVWGENNRAQYQLDPQGFYYQGRVEVRNGAIIENAEIAIQAWKHGTWNNGGGIIKTADATIRNCWKGIHYGYYTNHNSASYSKNSTFETTADLINGDVPQTFIEGWAFKGVKVNGCTFRNTNPNASDINQLGRGIYLESAKGIITGLTTATVTDFCDETNTNWQPNIFENLYKGVELVNYGMQQTNGIFTSTVTRNYFKNCVYGVECKGMPAVSINQNKIVLGANSVYNNYNEGITHKSYTGFSISENCVSQVGNNAAYTGGIIITEVGGDNNQVYRNFSFDNEHAYLSNGKNRTAAPDANNKFKGLQFLCNENNGTQQYDIAIEGDGNSPTNPMNGIRLYQGGVGSSQNPKSAANSFTHYCPSAESDIYNNTINPIIYFHDNSAIQIPSCYSWNVTPANGTYNSCPTKFGPHQMGGILTTSQKSLLLADFAIKNSQYLAVALLYNNIIDNGNTQSLLQSISTSLPTNAADLRDLMINNSPNLSDRVVQDLVKESRILQNSDLISIIAANPDIAHNEELLRMLQEKTNPMDNWMIDFLREAGTYETNRTLLEQTFADKQYHRDDIAWEMVRHLLSDTITDSINHTELHQWLNIIGSPRAKYMIADDFASMGEFSAASEVLNNINERNLDRYEIMELQGIKNWLSLQNILFNEGRNIYELTSAELESIRPYAENERMYGLAGTFAANVLNHYEPESYVLPTIYPENNRSSSNNDAQTKKKRTLKKLVQNVLVSKSDLTVYPNPVNNQLSIDLTNVERASILSIYSLKGDLILTQSVQNDKLIKLNTNGLANGSYTLEIRDNKGNSIKSEKIIVNHN